MQKMATVSMIYDAHRDANPEIETQDSIRDSPSEEDFDSYIKNSSVLYQLIVESSWDAVIERCNQYPKESEQVVVRESEDSWRRLPLHEACVRGANADVIEALLQAYPAAAKTEDHSDRLPLHHACFHGCSKAVVRKLICANPNGVYKKDVYGKTPMTIAESSSMSSKKVKSEIIELLSKDPEKCLVDEHRSKWEEEQEKIISNYQAALEREKAKHQLKIQSINAAMKDQWLKYENEIRFLKNQSNPRIDALVKDHRTEKNEMAAQNRLQLQKQRDLYERKIGDLEQKYEAASTRLVEMESKIPALTKSLQERNALENSLKSQLEKMNEQMTALAAKEAETSRQNSELLTEIANSNIEASSTILQLSSSIEREKIMEVEMKRLTQELKAEKLASKRLQHMMDSCRAENSSLTQQLASHRDGLALMQVKADFYKMRADESTIEKLEEARDENKKLLLRITELKNLIEEKDIELQLAEQKLEEACRNIDIVRGDFKMQLQSVEDSKTELIEMHEQEKHGLLVQISTLTSSIDDLNASAGILKEQLTKEEARSKEALMMFQTLWKSKEQKDAQASLV